MCLCVWVIQIPSKSSAVCTAAVTVFIDTGLLRQAIVAYCVGAVHSPLMRATISGLSECLWGQNTNTTRDVPREGSPGLYHTGTPDIRLDAQYSTGRHNGNTWVKNNT